MALILYFSVFLVAVVVSAVLSMAATAVRVVAVGPAVLAAVAAVREPPDKDSLVVPVNRVHRSWAVAVAVLAKPAVLILPVSAVTELPHQ
jgi:hypothetical protein